MPLRTRFWCRLRISKALEQHVIYLEETVNALTDSWQHIDTHRLCITDDSGAETCLTKPQLDALLVIQAKMTAIDPPLAIVGVEFGHGRHGT